MKKLDNYPQEYIQFLLNKENGLNPEENKILYDILFQLREKYTQKIEMPEFQNEILNKLKKEKPPAIAQIEKQATEGKIIRGTSEDKILDIYNAISNTLGDQMRKIMYPKIKL